MCAIPTHTGSETVSGSNMLDPWPPRVLMLLQSTILYVLPGTGWLALAVLTRASRSVSAPTCSDILSDDTRGHRHVPVGSGRPAGPMCGPVVVPRPD